MTYSYKFHQILSIKEHEKEAVLVEYNKSIENFEIVGKKLYELLKQKEERQAGQSEKITRGSSIEDIQKYQRFMLKIDQDINNLQQLVAEARAQMQAKEKLLLEANIEMKKYERMKEIDYENFVMTNKCNENKLMNEISVQQFLRTRVNTE
ncbi:flagellar export protein FliJ [Bacillus sp. SCS-151]|uniref:flagellar export protein FliJ n=1 Tax=Nanhaiella sioensis TaxID=3115293 RepID=UPI00397D1A34